MTCVKMIRQTSQNELYIQSATNKKSTLQDYDTFGLSFDVSPWPFES